MHNRILAAFDKAGIGLTYHGDGVYQSGDTSTDHPSTEAAFGEIMIVQSEEGTFTVSVVWRNSEGDVVDAQEDSEHDREDVDGIVNAVRALI